MNILSKHTSRTTKMAKSTINLLSAIPYSLVLLILLLPGHPSAQETLQVFDNGTDGDVRYYSVVCPSSKRTSVSNYYEKGEICTVLVSTLERVCRTNWDIDTAAITACSQGK